MFGSRSLRHELMDDHSIQDDRIDRALRELTVINTWLGGHSTSLRGIRRAVRHIPEDSPISILDVGAGGSDLPEILPRLGREFRITSLDINGRACEYSAQRHPGAAVVQGSVLNLPFRANSFDLVHVSMFLHHFTDEELGAIVESLDAVARYGIVVNDLRRSVAAYGGIMLLTRLLSRSALVRHDAPLSVLRGFNRREVERLAGLLHPRIASIERTWAYRWLICIGKP